MSDLLLPVYGSRTRYLSSRAVRWLVVFMVACAAQLRATEYVNESFRGTNAAEWVFVAGQGDGPSLTAARAIDGVGDGWLRLTDDLQNQSSFVYYTNTVPTTNGLLITFDFAIWTTENRPAADGFAFAVFAPVETPEPGGYGGSLGYAQRFAIGGLDEAIVGFGFDAHGNFSAPTEGRVGGPGRRRNSIAIRGPMGEARDEGYEYITGTGSLDAFFTQNQASRDNVTIHSVRISISPDKAASVAWTDGDGGWERLIWEDCDIPCPENVMIGFTAGTGGSRANHEIRDLIVSSHTSESFVWDGGSAVDAHWGTDENWLDDDGPGFGATADLVFSTPDADRLDNFLGAERIVRTLTFPSNSAPAAVTLRTTTSATGTDAANLVFAAEGDGAAVILRKGMTNHVTIGNGGGNLVLSNSLFVAHHGTGDLTFGRPVTGIGGLTKTGSGSLTLSAANTYAGNSTLLGGVITLAASGTLGGTGNDLFVWDGTLDLGGTLQTKATVRLYDGALTNGTLTVNSRFHFHGGEFDAVLQGNGGVDKWDSATTLTLGQDNSYNGTTVVRAGTLLVNNPGATGSGTGAGAVTVLNSALVGGRGRIGDSLTFNSGAKFVFKQTDTLNVGGSVTFNGFGIEHMEGLDADTPSGLYTPIEGGVSSASGLANVGWSNYVQLGPDRYTYFEVVDDSLVVVVTDQVPTLAVIAAVRSRIEDGVAVISWDVCMEIGTVGYHLHRWEDGQWTKINDSLIPVNPLATPPVTYVQIDPGAPLGKTQRYRIVELDDQGCLLCYGPYDLDLSGDEVCYETWTTGIDWGEADASPDADPDGDGLNNFQEYLAGSNPLDANSLLRVNTSELTDNGVLLRWASEPGRVYVVEMTQSLSQPFVAVQTGLDATPPENTWLVPINPVEVKGSFFRVVIAQ